MNDEKDPPNPFALCRLIPMESSDPIGHKWVDPRKGFHLHTVHDDPWPEQIEMTPQMQEFLDQQRYLMFEHTMRQIMIGLGIPPDVLKERTNVASKLGE